MTISFKYKINPQKKGDKIKTPSIPITLFGNNSTPIDVIALLDSGADLSVIPEGLAKFLNLDLTGETSICTGIGGEVEVKTTLVDIKISHAHESYSFKIPVQVILGEDKIPPLLGRTGFFDKFIVTFEQFNEKVKLKYFVKENFK